MAVDLKEIANEDGKIEVVGYKDGGVVVRKPDGALAVLSIRQGW